jgi:hypothetical protein
MSEEDEITRQLQTHIADIKKDIKAADSEKTGTMKEPEFIQMLKRYGVK